HDEFQGRSDDRSQAPKDSDCDRDNGFEVHRHGRRGSLGSESRGGEKGENEDEQGKAHCGLLSTKVSVYQSLPALSPKISENKADNDLPDQSFSIFKVLTLQHILTQMTLNCQ